MLPLNSTPGTRCTSQHFRDWVWIRGWEEVPRSGWVSAVARVAYCGNDIMAPNAAGGAHGDSPLHFLFRSRHGSQARKGDRLRFEGGGLLALAGLGLGDVGK
jgi:hypothetical protein